jgi:phage-related tail fiber protein
MSITLGLKLTLAGQIEFADAITAERLVNITQLVLGDANGAWYEVTGAETELLNEQWRGPILQIIHDPNILNRIVCDAPVPVAGGGFTIREFGLLSDAGVLMAIGMHQVIELPAADSSTTLDIVIRALLDVVNADVVNLVVDPYIVTATRIYVDTEIAKIEERARYWAFFGGGQ